MPEDARQRESDDVTAALSARRLLAENGWAVLAAAVATVGIQLGVYYLGAGSAGKANGVLAMLAAAAVWVPVAGALLAAGRSRRMGAVLRGGTVIDASAVSLLWVWIFARGGDGSPYVTFVAAAKVYCILLATGLAGIAAARLGRTGAGRMACGVAAAGVLLAALATPFWTGGLLACAEGGVRQSVVAMAVHVNPFYSMTAAVAEQIRFAWNEAPLMYRITLIGDYAAAPPARWYTTVVIWSIVAGILAATHLLRSGKNRQVPGTGVK